MKRVLIFCLLVGFLLFPTYGGEFQINTHTTWDQADPDVDVAANGSFVVVWRSYGQDGSSNGIYGQRFDPNHSPAGEEFQVNSIITGNQTEPAVATDAAAGFVVTWRGPSIDDPNRDDIFARWFDSNGCPIADELQINNNIIGRQLCPRVAMNQSGDCIIVWESVDFPEEGNRTICGRLFGGTDMEFDNEFIISEEISPCRYPDVAMDPNGNFIVVWLVDKSSNSVMARLYDPNGLSKTESFEVNTVSFKSITQPTVAVDEAGCVIVTWDGDPNLASLDDIHARIFDPNGTAFGEQFIVNTTREEAQQNPRAVMNGSGGFVIVWESRTDPNVNERDIFCQRYDSFGEPIGKEFQLNTTMEADQRFPAVAMVSDSRFVTVWQSDEQDGSGFGIFGRSEALFSPADFNYDGNVNFRDYWILSEEWQTAESPLVSDLIEDGIIDELDLTEFCRQWLMP